MLALGQAYALPIIRGSRFPLGIQATRFPVVSSLFRFLHRQHSGTGATLLVQQLRGYHESGTPSSSSSSFSSSFHARRSRKRRSAGERAPSGALPPEGRSASYHHHRQPHKPQPIKERNPVRMLPVAPTLMQREPRNNNNNNKGEEDGTPVGKNKVERWSPTPSPRLHRRNKSTGRRDMEAGDAFLAEEENCKKGINDGDEQRLVVEQQLPGGMERLSGLHVVLNILRVFAAPQRDLAPLPQGVRAATEQEVEQPQDVLHRHGQKKELLEKSTQPHPHRKALGCLYVRDFNAEALAGIRSNRHHNNSSTSTGSRTLLNDRPQDTADQEGQSLPSSSVKPNTRREEEVVVVVEGAVGDAGAAAAGASSSSSSLIKRIPADGYDTLRHILALVDWMNAHAPVVPPPPHPSTPPAPPTTAPASIPSPIPPTTCSPPPPARGGGSHQPWLSVQFVSRRQLTRLAGGDRRHQNAVLEVSPFQPLRVHSFEEVWSFIRATSSSSTGSGCSPPSPQTPMHILYLDRILDPVNVGGILRTAYCFGIDYVILSRGCAPCSPATARTSVGLMEHLKGVFRCVGGPRQRKQAAASPLEDDGETQTPSPLHHSHEQKDSAAESSGGGALPTVQFVRAAQAWAAGPSPGPAGTLPLLEVIGTAATSSSAASANHRIYSEPPPPPPPLQQQQQQRERVRLLLLGNERDGLPPAVCDACDWCLHLRSPRADGGTSSPSTLPCGVSLAPKGVEISLNVHAACAALLTRLML